MQREIRKCKADGKSRSAAETHSFACMEDLSEQNIAPELQTDQISNMVSSLAVKLWCDVRRDACAARGAGVTHGSGARTCLQSSFRMSCEQ